MSHSCGIPPDSSLFVLLEVTKNADYGPGGASGYSGAGKRKHLCDDGAESILRGHPPAENPDPQPDADESGNGNTAPAAARKHPAPGGSGTAAKRIRTDAWNIW